MQITHNGKTYKWKCDEFGTIPRESYYQEIKRQIEDLVKLGYMELIETKPCEHHGWGEVSYVDGKMVCKNCGKDCRIIDEETKPCEHKPCSLPGGKTLCCVCEKEIELERNEVWRETKPEEKPTEDIQFPEGCFRSNVCPETRLRIKGTDHDKAMEIPEVDKYHPRAEDMSYDSATYDQAELQLELLTNSLNAVIRYLKSK